MIQTLALIVLCVVKLSFLEIAFRHEQEVVWLHCTDVRYEAVAPACQFPVLLLENQTWKHLRPSHSLKIGKKRHHFLVME